MNSLIITGTNAAGLVCNNYRGGYLCFLFSVVLTDLVTVSDEEAVTALPESSETLAGMRMQVEELTSRTATLATPALMASSVRRTVVPSVRRISTAVTYGLDRLESEGTHALKASMQAGLV